MEYKIIRNRTMNASYLDHLIDNEEAITNMNNFFVSVGLTLTKEINHPQDGGVVQYLGERNPSSIF